MTVAATQEYEAISTIHVVSKTHLDLGFTAQPAEVVSDYLDLFIPRVITVNQRLQDAGRSERQVWTVGSWLINEYLESANADQTARLEGAIARDEIAWSGLPFTPNTEVFSAELFRRALAISKRLDERFGKQTIAAKLTDVPGHTRAMVPLLAEAGIELLHIGINGGIVGATLPPMFNWVDQRSGTSIAVVYHDDYGGFFSPPGSAHALSVNMTFDNEGPQSLQSTVAHFDNLRRKYPGATVVGSTLNLFAAGVRSIVPTLPVIVDEVGDSWVYGVASRPELVRKYRALCRWLDHHHAAEGTIEFANQLMLVAEHTWGLDTIMLMPESLQLMRNDVESDREAGLYRQYEMSWDARDRIPDRAIDTLPTAELRRSANAAISLPDNPSRLQVDGLSTVRFDLGSDGALRQCVLVETGESILSSVAGSLVYQSYGEADYQKYRSHYVRHTGQSEWWVDKAFGKPGLANVRPGPMRAFVPMVVGERSFLEGDSEGVEVEVVFQADNEDFRENLPRQLTISYVYSPLTRGIETTVRWSGKKATRLPEALWCNFSAPSASAVLELKKLGSWMSPHDVVANGARRTHSVDDMVRWTDEAGESLTVTSLDAPLVTFERPRLLQQEPFELPVGSSANFCLFNNLWGTNYPLWVEGASVFRFWIASDVREEVRPNYGRG